MTEPFLSPHSSVSLSSPTLAEAHQDQLERDGWCVIPSVLSTTQVDMLTQALRDFVGETAHSPTLHEREAPARTRGGQTFALRGALQVPTVRALCRDAGLRGLITPVLGTDARAVRGIVFDKTPAANWKVPWHQDLSIAVRKRVDASNFGPWSEKASVPHVQPPAEVLAAMLTVRLHLDECDARNGPLRVFSGSHQPTKWSTPEISAWRERESAVEVHVPRGGALLMRPLLLHASSPSVEPQLPRRVLHIEWASEDLPGELEWFERV